MQITGIETASRRKIDMISPLPSYNSNDYENTYDPYHNLQNDINNNEHQQTLNNLLLYQSEYVKYSPLQNKKQQQRAHYFNDNTLNYQRYSEQHSSEISEDMLYKFLLSITQTIQPKIRKLQQEAFQLIMVIPAKVFSQFDPNDYQDNQQQLELQLSDDQPIEPFPRKSKQFSGGSPVYHGSQISFGQSAEINSVPFSFNTQIKRKAPVLTTNSSERKSIKLMTSALKQVYLQHLQCKQGCFNISKQVQKLSYKKEKMNHLSKLPTDMIMTENIDQKINVEYPIDISIIQRAIEKNQTVKDMEQILSTSSFQVGELFQNSKIDQNNQINNLPENSSVLQQTNKYVKNIKQSILVYQPRPISYNQINIQQQQISNANTRPTSYFQTPSSPHHHTQQLKHHSPIKFTHNSPINQDSVKNSHHNRYINSQINGKDNFQTLQHNRPLSEYSKFQSVVPIQNTRISSPQANAPKYADNYSTHQNLYQNSEQNNSNVFARTQYYGIQQKSPQIITRRPDIKIQYNPSYERSDNRKILTSARSAPTSPMVTRNLRNIPSNFTEEGRIESQFRKINPEGHYSTHDSYNQSIQNNVKSQLIKPHSYYLGHLNSNYIPNEYGNYNPSRKQNRKQYGNIHTSPSVKVISPKIGEKNINTNNQRQAIQHQYYDYPKNIQSGGSKKKINLVTNRNQIIGKKSTKK